MTAPAGLSPTHTQVTARVAALDRLLLDVDPPRIAMAETLRAVSEALYDAATGEVAVEDAVRDALAALAGLEAWQAQYMAKIRNGGRRPS